MPDAALTPSAAEFALAHLSISSGQITVVVRAKRPFVSCPSCGGVSRRIHSRYVRQLADLPWHGGPIRIERHTRRFFCDSPGCERRIFTERLPETTCCRARRTRRLLYAHRLIALALGGEAGVHLAREFVRSFLALLRHVSGGLPQGPLDNWTLDRAIPSAPIIEIQHLRHSWCDLAK